MKSNDILLERNVINSGAIKQRVKELINRSDNAIIRRWLKGNYANWLRDVYSDFEEVKTADDYQRLTHQEAPDWFVQKLGSPDIADDPFLYIHMMDGRLSEIENKIIEYLTIFISDVRQHGEGVDDEQIAKRVARITPQHALDGWKEAHDRMERANKKLADKAARDGAVDSPNEKTVMTFDGGYRMVEFKSDKDGAADVDLRQAMQRESGVMNICVGQFHDTEKLKGGYGESYAYGIEHGNLRIFSLRDTENVPHVTIEYDNGRLKQVKGNSNQPPKPEYVPMVKSFLNKMALPVYDKTDIDNMGLHFTSDGRYGSLDEIMEAQDVLDGGIKVYDVDDSLKFMIGDAQILNVGYNHTTVRSLSGELTDEQAKPIRKWFVDKGFTIMRDGDVIGMVRIGQSGYNGTWVSLDDAHKVTMSEFKGDPHVSKIIKFEGAHAERDIYGLVDDNEKILNVIIVKPTEKTVENIDNLQDENAKYPYYGNHIKPFLKEMGLIMNTDDSKYIGMVSVGGYYVDPDDTDVVKVTLRFPDGSHMASIFADSDGRLDVLRNKKNVHMAYLEYEENTVTGIYNGVWKNGARYDLKSDKDFANGVKQRLKAYIKMKKSAINDNTASELGYRQFGSSKMWADVENGYQRVVKELDTCTVTKTISDSKHRYYYILRSKSDKAQVIFCMEGNTVTDIEPISGRHLNRTQEKMAHEFVRSHTPRLVMTGNAQSYGTVGAEQLGYLSTHRDDQDQFLDPNDPNVGEYQYDIGGYQISYMSKHKRDNGSNTVDETEKYYIIARKNGNTELVLNHSSSDNYRSRGKLKNKPLARAIAKREGFTFGYSNDSYGLYDGISEQSYNHDVAICPSNKKLTTGKAVYESSVGSIIKWDKNRKSLFGDTSVSLSSDDFYIVRPVNAKSDLVLKTRDDNGETVVSKLSLYDTTDTESEIIRGWIDENSYQVDADVGKKLGYHVGKISDQKYGEEPNPKDGHGYRSLKHALKHHDPEKIQAYILADTALYSDYPAKVDHHLAEHDNETEDLFVDAAISAFKGNGEFDDQQSGWYKKKKILLHDEFEIESAFNAGMMNFVLNLLDENVGIITDEEKRERLRSHVADEIESVIQTMKKNDNIYMASYKDGKRVVGSKTMQFMAALGLDVNELPVSYPDNIIDFYVDGITENMNGDSSSEFFDDVDDVCWFLYPKNFTASKLADYIRRFNRDVKHGLVPKSDTEKFRNTIKNSIEEVISEHEISFADKNELKQFKTIIRYVGLDADWFDEQKDAMQKRVSEYVDDLSYEENGSEYSDNYYATETKDEDERIDEWLNENIPDDYDFRDQVFERLGYEEGGDEEIDEDSSEYEDALEELKDEWRSENRDDAREHAETEIKEEEEQQFNEEKSNAQDQVYHMMAVWGQF